MTTLYFIRHGETENADQILKGRMPGLNLTAKGQGEVANLAASFKNKKAAAIFSSPVDRCFETARALSRVMGQPMTVDDRLVEVATPYQGVSMESFHHRFLGKYLYADFRQLQEGESDLDIIARMDAFLKEILEKYRDQTVLAVSHGDPIMLLAYTITGKDRTKILVGATPDYIPLAGYFKWQFDGEKLTTQKRSWK